jgi:hypothetical protein
MSRKERKSKGKKVNPTFFVFCEGKTEEKYINFLKTQFRIPIFIDSQIAGNRINENYINNYKKSKTIHEKDKTFLVYDIDAPKMLEKLKTIKNTILLDSNPCFEIWFLLHFQEQNSEINCKDCNKLLLSKCDTYKKGKISPNLSDFLKAKMQKAIHLSQKLEIHKNPSTQIFKLINELENIKKI